MKINNVNQSKKEMKSLFRKANHLMELSVSLADKPFENNAEKYFGSFVQNKLPTQFQYYFIKNYKGKIWETN